MAQVDEQDLGLYDSRSSSSAQEIDILIHRHVWL